MTTMRRRTAKERTLIDLGEKIGNHLFLTQNLDFQSFEVRAAFLAAILAEVAGYNPETHEAFIQAVADEALGMVREVAAEAAS
jgi:hypothetical protein